MRKAFNNIYVKNFPTSWTEDDLKKIFSQYGNILSLFLNKNEKGAFAFVCYGDASGKDKEAGPKAAMKAVEELNNKMIDGKELYCKEALGKADRQIEKTKEMLRYKNSKKRCNLYVKNFPPTTTKEQLEELFGKYGEIENIKLFPKEGEALYAFVCFKNPEKASQAKAELNQTTFNGKQLYINHYEIKEIRKVQYEEVHDKTDFQNFKKQSLGYTVDLFNKPEIYALLNQIFTYIQPKLRSQFQGPNQMRRGGPRQFNQG
jgi:polyadenylate-binding protein